MALTDDQLAQVRRMVADTTSETWSDDDLRAAAEAFLNSDGSYNLRGLTASLWEERAAGAWELVQTSESGSSRAAQQAFDHALAMAKRFKDDDSSDGTDPTAQYPRSTRIVRPTLGA